MQRSNDEYYRVSLIMPTIAAASPRGRSDRQRRVFANSFWRIGARKIIRDWQTGLVTVFATSLAPAGRPRIHIVLE